MKYGMNSYRKEDDIALDPVIPSDSAVVEAEANEAQGDISEIVQLSEAINEYVEVSDGVDEIQVEATENIQNVNEENAQEEIVKLERDINAILSRINANVKKSRFSQSSFGRRVESDFKLLGKKGYVARVESLSEVGKKIWDNIKAFFAKIWEFLKSLFERFTALFKSNKSVLEGLKKKLESMEDDDFEECDKDKMNTALRFYSTCHKDYIKFLQNDLKSYSYRIERMAKEKDKLLKMSKNSDTTDGENRAIDVFMAEKIDEINRQERKIRCNSIDFSLAGTKIDKTNIEGLKKEYNNFTGITVSGDNVYGFAYGIKKKDSSVHGMTSNEMTVKATVYVKLKKLDNFSKGNKRDILIDLCDFGIELCDELSGELIKDAKDTYKEFEDKAKDLVDGLYDKYDKDEDNRGSKGLQKYMSKQITMDAGFFASAIAQYGNQPSQVVSAIRNGMSICSKKK